jgi:hypothetical protein
VHVEFEHFAYVDEFAFRLGVPAGAGKSHVFNYVSFCSFKPWLETVFDELEQSRLCGPGTYDVQEIWAKTLHKPFDCDCSNWFDAMLNKHNRLAMRKECVSEKCKSRDEVFDVIDLSLKRVGHIPHIGACEEAPIRVKRSQDLQMWIVPISYWEVN